MQNKTVSIESCQQMLTASIETCHKANESATVTQPVGGENLANSFAALSTSIGWGALVVAIITLLIAVLIFIAGWQWGKIISRDAKHEAIKAAKDSINELAPQICNEWLGINVPGILRGFQKISDDDSIPVDNSTKTDIDVDKFGQDTGGEGNVD